MIGVIVYVHAIPTSEFPMVGASGAIAALAGAYPTLVVRWKMPDGKVWPFAWNIHPLGFTFLAAANFILDTGAFVSHSQEKVAFGAHVGGFLGGAFLAMIISSVWRAPQRVEAEA